MPTALITGINGQDGSYLAEFLLRKGYCVVGTTRDQNADQGRILHIRDKIDVIETDLLDQGVLEDILRKHKPNEVYNLAARAVSVEFWTEPVATGELNGLSVARMVEAIRKVEPRTRFCQASSQAVFDDATESPQTEETPFRPRNPYGAAKAYGHWITVNYRKRHGLFACSAILYNHESPRRRLEFVTRKITRAVAEIKLGLSRKLSLGRLEARRDWGFAGDYVRAMWLMLQQPQADDYIIATGQTHSVRDFCEIAFGHVGLDYREYVVEEPANFRDPEAAQLVGNTAKANRVLGWHPEVAFPDLVRMMVESDLKSLQDRQRRGTSDARGV